MTLLYFVHDHHILQYKTLLMGPILMKTMLAYIALEF
jgi:hypothetical protein